MKYEVVRDECFDFLGESYYSKYPNLHKYPATMLPQIGIKLFKDFNITKGNLLDPYCGSGSSFACGLEYGIEKMEGFDINPLAVLITKAKFTKIDFEKINFEKKCLRDKVFEFIKDEGKIKKLPFPKITNINYYSNLQN